MSITWLWEGAFLSTSVLWTGIIFQTGCTFPKLWIMVAIPGSQLWLQMPFISGRASSCGTMQVIMHVMGIKGPSERCTRKASSFHMIMLAWILSFIWTATTTWYNTIWRNPLIEMWHLEGRYSCYSTIAIVSVERTLWFLGFNAPIRGSVWLWRM